MSLITCPDCRKQFSDAASACPSCGRPNGTSPQLKAQRVNVTIQKKRSPITTGCLIVLGLIVLVSLKTFMLSDSSAPSGPQVEVEEASPKQMALVNEVLEKGLEARNGVAVKSTRHQESWYYVGAKIFGPGLDGTKAIWFISGSKEDPKMILSVDHVAAEFSAPRMANKTKAGADLSDLEAQIIEKHLASLPNE